MNVHPQQPEAAAQCPFHAAAGAPAPALDEAQAAQSVKEGTADSPRVGVLLVNHGSHSPTWRRMLLDVHAEVKDELLALPNVQSVRTGFMEYTEPSIATQLKAFDREGVERILIVPLLLTISGHSFDDIPAICGMKSDPEVLANLEEEKIERYSPQAAVDLAPLLDYPRLVRKNVARRVAELRGDSAGRDGLVLVGYGSAEFPAAWEAFFQELRAFAVQELGVVVADHAWCGHLVQYSSEPTAAAIREVLRTADRALVLPILVACDEMFQGRVIGGAVREAGPGVLYKGDAILPEPEVGRWVVTIVKDRIARYSGVSG